MKHIVIYQENTQPLIIEDNDNSKVEDFSKELANILESNNVSILHTSKSSVIIRPNKITSIVVYETSSPVSKEVDIEQKEQEEKIEEQEDIITD